MSHEIESMAWAGKTPWHGLGKKVPPDLTPRQMLKAAGLDWTVRKESTWFLRPAAEDDNPDIIDEGNVMVEMDTCALLRSSDNRKLAEVSKDWNPVQNEEAFKFFNDFIATGDMEMHTAGSLHSGEIVWALAKVKESFNLFGGDQVDSFLLFTNPHRFGQSIDIRFTPIRVVCANTLSLSLNTTAKNMVRITHRKKFDEDKVKEMLGVAHVKLEEYKALAELLGSKRYDKESLEQYFDAVFPVFSSKDEDDEDRKTRSKTSQKALDSIHTQPGAQFAEGSWWQAFNTVTYLTDHIIGRSDDTRLYSAWFGQNRNLKMKALELATEFAEHS